MTSTLQSLIKEREEAFHKEFFDKNENRHFFPIDDVESFNRTTIRKTLEAVREMCACPITNEVRENKRG